MEGKGRSHFEVRKTILLFSPRPSRLRSAPSAFLFAFVNDRKLRDGRGSRIIPRQGFGAFDFCLHEKEYAIHWPNQPT
jgi:hypothetical protein